MDSEFRACAVCTHTCFKEHGADATQAASPHFTRPPCFILTSLEGSSNWTPIPRDFAEAHGETLRGTVRILGANGKEWSVEVGGPGKLLGFNGGWKNFVVSTSAKRGDQMLFSLVSKKCFSVYVFNKLGVEGTPSPSVDPKNAALAIGKRKRQEVKAEPESDDSDSESSDNNEYEASKSDVESRSDSDTETSPKFNGGKSGDGEVCSTVKRAVKRKFTGSMEVDPKLGCKKKVMTAYTKDDMFIEPGSMTTTYESLRREVTQAERDRTVEAARSLRTEYPSIPVLMMPSHVYRGFWLTIPGKFSRKFLPQDKTEIILQDIHGFEWPATWIRNDHHTGVSGGWAAFSKDHCLEEGDVCVYEVIDCKDWRVLVHIFRVVNVFLVPGTRGGWEKTYNIVHGAMMNKSGKTRSRKYIHNTVKRKPDRRNKKASFSHEFHTVDDGVPLTKLYKEKRSDGNSDLTSDEIYVKPKVLSLNPIPKIAKVELEPGAPATVKVNQELGVSAMRKFKQQNGVYCGDVKPTLEELKASLNMSALPRDPICELFQNIEKNADVRSSVCIVKPEPVETESLYKEVGRTWYPVVNMLGKRQSLKSPNLHELLVALGGVFPTSESSCACEDGNGNWWVPRSHFSSDLSTCYID